MDTVWWLLGYKATSTTAQVGEAGLEASSNVADAVAGAAGAGAGAGAGAAPPPSTKELQNDTSTPSPTAAPSLSERQQKEQVQLGGMFGLVEVPKELQNDTTTPSPTAASRILKPSGEGGENAAWKGTWGRLGDDRLGQQERTPPKAPAPNAAAGGMYPPPKAPAPNAMERHVSDTTGDGLKVQSTFPKAFGKAIVTSSLCGGCGLLYLAMVRKGKNKGKIMFSGPVLAGTLLAVPVSTWSYMRK